VEHDQNSGAGPSTTGNEDVPTPERRRERPCIYVASLADYNAGTLHGAWIDVTTDVDKISERVELMLATSPTTANAEEYAIHDFEAFGAYRPDEHDNLDWLHAIAVGIVEHGLEFAAWAVDCDHDRERLEKFDDAYLGNYDRAAEYAEQLADDIGLQRIIDEHIPDSLAAYITINIDALARDLELGGDIRTVEHEDGVWIFDPRI
jgi:antirestriction protein